MLKELITLEKSLHLKENRTNKDYLALILADDFKEITSFGKMWDKQETLANLVSELNSEVEIDSFNFEIQKLSEEMWLIIYETKLSIDSLTYHSTRSSLWKTIDGKFKLFFHQASRH